MKRHRKFANSRVVALSYNPGGVNYTFENLKETGRAKNKLNNLKKLRGPSRYIVQYEASAIKGLGLIENISDKGISYSRIWIRQPPLKTNVINNKLPRLCYPLIEPEFKKIKKDFFEGTINLAEGG